MKTYTIETDNRKMVVEGQDVRVHDQGIEVTHSDGDTVAFVPHHEGPILVSGDTEIEEIPNRRNYVPSLPKTEDEVSEVRAEAELSEEEQEADDTEAPGEEDEEEASEEDVEGEE